LDRLTFLQVAKAFVFSRIDVALNGSWFCSILLPFIPKSRAAANIADALGVVSLVRV
jgi:hypothetical protein